MISVLGKIQNTVNKYAEVISQILGVDVEIMDSNFIRLAGTGEYKNYINNDMSCEGNVYKTVLESGKSLMINEPKRHPLCRTCPKVETCLEKFEMCTPIKLGSEVIGVIGLICFSEEQKGHIFSNLETYTTFLEQIADLISAKAYETLENENIIKRIDLLNEIIDKIDEGVIVLDKHNHISHLNKNAVKILNIKAPMDKQLNLIPTGNNFSDQDEYKLKLNNNNYLLMGKTYKVNMGEDKFDSIFIFEETKTINHLITTLTNQEASITLNNILSVSSQINNLKEHVMQVAASTSTVLITGESGTGKEMFARAIHKLSDRKNMPFVAINCGAIPESLLESELFGYVRGAFTGADPKGKIGKFELADKGTIFLDEIGDMPLYMQVKLLRSLQEREIIKIGSTQPIKIDVRIIAATNRNLEEMISEHLFREDLFYRLNVIPLEIPPLRYRKEDIPILTNFFANKYSELFNKDFNFISKDVLDFLNNYNWPGNVRELENTVEFMVNMMDSNGIINRSCLPKRIMNEEKNKAFAKANTKTLNLKELEKHTIKKALEIYGISTEGKKLASHHLGIGIATLYRKMQEYKLI